MIKEEFYENYRKQSREYMLRLLIESKCDTNFKKTIGEAVFKLYESIYFKNIKEYSKEEFQDKDSDFLYFLDLLSVYVLEVPIMKTELNSDTHIDRLNDEELRSILRYLISFKNKI